MEVLEKEKIAFNNDTEFMSIIQDLIENETVRKMASFRQHYDTTCLDHCLHVAYYSYLICKKHGLDYKSAARAGLLHDLFLYDWRKRENGRKGLHAFTHPKTALYNATRLFNLNKKEQDIILKHMWPLTIVPPKYLESYVITFVDKYCALEESFSNYKHCFETKKIYRYSYIFLSMFVFRII